MGGMSTRLGGDQQTVGELNERARRVLAPLPTVDLGWPWQCRCGGTQWVRYRGRFYCPQDCRRWPHPDAELAGRSETFRQAFERAVANAPAMTGGVAVAPEMERKLRRAAANQRRWRAERDALIVQAHADGGGVREIARLVGLTHPGVLRILARDQEPDRPAV
jgi:hypothetical protein